MDMRYLGLVLLIFVVIVSGCNTEGPLSIARKMPIIIQYMNEHPNGNVKITYFSLQQSNGIINNVRDECGNESIQPSRLYLINISEGGSNAVAWVDWNAQKVLCAYKKGSGQGCEHHAKTACHGNYIYWFDSCNNLEDEKEYCEDGCKGGNCVIIKKCVSHSDYKCYNDSIYWIDSCGNIQEIKESCDYGCLNKTCKTEEEEKCWDSDSGKNYKIKGITETFTGKRMEDYCDAQGKLVEMFCLNGNISQEVYTCPEKCENGACVTKKKVICSDSDGGLNFSLRGEVSGFEPVIGTIYEHDGELDALYVESTSKAILKILGDTHEVILGGTYNYSIGSLYIRAVYFYGQNNTNNNIETLTTTAKDYCLGNYTIEHYCVTTTSFGKMQYKCPEICKDGACVSINETL